MKFFINLCLSCLILFNTTYRIVPEQEKNEYKEFISHAATFYDVDKYLIYAIIENESGWIAEIENKSSGAMGLMQIMPDGWDFTIELLKEDLAATELSLDPFNGKDNILVGIRLLRYFMDRNEFLFALDSYAVGETGAREQYTKYGDHTEWTYKIIENAKNLEINGK